MGHRVEGFGNFSDLRLGLKEGMYPGGRRRRRWWWWI